MTNPICLIPARLCVFLILISSSSLVSAFSILEWFGLGDKKEQEEVISESVTAKTTNWAEASAEPVVSVEADTSEAVKKEVVNFDDVKTIVANLRPGQRNQLLSDEAAFNNFIQQQAMNQSVLTAARANRLEEDALTKLLMRSSAENTLREIYIKRLISKELPAAFPSEEQVKTFYDNNQDRFTLEERVHLWQIFIPFAQDADEKTKESVKKQATSLKKQIDTNKISFAQAATEQSQHLASRHAGGYMGLIKLSDIKPEISESVLGLKEGVLSSPILTDDGYHLIKRGTKIAASTLPFEQVKARINQALRQEAEKRLRQAIFEQASKTYGQELGKKRIEEWRLKLRTNL